MVMGLKGHPNQQDQRLGPIIDKRTGSILMMSLIHLINPCPLPPYTGTTVCCTRLPRLNVVINVNPLVTMSGCVALLVVGSVGAGATAAGLSAASAVDVAVAAAAGAVLLEPTPRVRADSRVLLEDVRGDAIEYIISLINFVLK